MCWVYLLVSLLSKANCHVTVTVAERRHGEQRDQSQVELLLRLLQLHYAKLDLGRALHVHGCGILPAPCQ